MTQPRRPRHDAGNMLAYEAILVALILFGALYFVGGLSYSSTDRTAAQRDITLAGEDAMTVLAGLPSCMLLEGAALVACEDAFGPSALTRAITEALVGEPANLSLKLRTLLPPEIEWNFYLDNSFGSRAVHAPSHPPGERVSATYAFTPEWNRTFLATHQSSYNWTASGENDLVVFGLATWKSRGVIHSDDADATVRFTNGDALELANVAVDGERGRLSTLAYWRMNEGTGPDVADDRGRHPLTGVADPARWVTGRVGRALDFSAPAHELASAASAELTTDRVSVLTWVRPDAAPAGGNVRVWKYETSSGETLELMMEDATGRPVARVTDGVTETLATSTDALDPGTWTHVTVTLDGARLRVLVNGTVSATATTTLGLTDSGTATFSLGGKRDAADPDTLVFDGRVDEVRLYDRVLATNEFSGLRWASIAPKRGADPGWDARTAPTTGAASTMTWRGTALPGATAYDVSTDARVSAATPAITEGLNNSTLAVYDNESWARTVPLGGEVAIEFDFGPVLDRLQAEGRTVTAEKWVTVSVRSPVSQIPGTNDKNHELHNFTLAADAGYANFTVPRAALLGTHFVVASLNLTLQDGADLGIVARKIDYFHVVLPDTTEAPINPVYRAVLEMWVPEWR